MISRPSCSGGGIQVSLPDPRQRRPEGRTRAVIALTLALALGSCGGEDVFSPTTETVAGAYTASVLTLSSSVGTTDLLALGSTVAIRLAVDGTTSGRLFIPGGAEDGSDLDVDLGGTWTLAGSTVTFNQPGDTFIRDVEFTAGRNQLNGEGVFSGTIIRLVLGKTS
jgi:hypothetical protein